MQLTVIGVTRMSGIGKESGKPFDFAQVHYLRALDVVSGEKFSLSGYGYEAGKMDLAIEAIPKFGAVKFPAVLDLEVDNVPGRMGLRAVIVGFKPQRVAA